MVTDCEEFPPIEEVCAWVFGIKYIRRPSLRQNPLYTKQMQKKTKAQKPKRPNDRHCWRSEAMSRAHGRQQNNWRFKCEGGRYRRKVM